MAQPATAIAASVDTELGRLAAINVPPGPGATGLSAVRPMPLSTYAMDARLTLARHAQKTLDVQYYHFANDATTLRIKARASVACPAPNKSIRKITITAGP